MTVLSAKSWGHRFTHIGPVFSDELVLSPEEAVPSVSALSSDNLDEAGHPPFATSNRHDSVVARWSRAVLVSALAFSFVLLVFGCKASLFDPGDGLRCRVARIEVSGAVSPRAHRSTGMIRLVTEHAKSFCHSELPTPMSHGRYERLDIGSLVNCLLEEFNSRSPPFSIRS